MRDGDVARALHAEAEAELVLHDPSMPPHRDPEKDFALIAAFAPAPLMVMTGHADHALALKVVDAAAARGAWRTAAGVRATGKPDRSW